MWSFRTSFLVLFLGLGTQSCAAMFTGTKSTVFVDSEPRGIPFAAGDVSGITPQTVEISKKVKEIVFTPAESREVRQVLNRRLQGGMVLMDILFTPGYGLVGILVDGTTGAWYKHDPAVFFRLDGAERAGPEPIASTRPASVEP